MATVMLMHWREASPDGLHVLDVWESEQAFNNFMEQRLAPAIHDIGIQGQPR